VEEGMEEEMNPPAEERSILGDRLLADPLVVAFISYEIIGDSADVDDDQLRQQIDDDTRETLAELVEGVSAACAAAAIMGGCNYYY
jgi:hypothetical protein